MQFRLADVIKTFVRLAIVALLANAAWQLFTVYWAHFKFDDAVRVDDAVPRRQDRRADTRAHSRAGRPVRRAGLGREPDDPGRRRTTRSSTAPTRGRSSSCPASPIPGRSRFTRDTVKPPSLELTVSRSSASASSATRAGLLRQPHGFGLDRVDVRRIGDAADVDLDVQARAAERRRAAARRRRRRRWPRRGGRAPRPSSPARARPRTGA